MIPMRTGYIIVLALLLLAGCGTVEKEQVEEKLSDTQAKTIENLIGFFDDNAWDSTRMVYYSDLDNTGNVLSERVYTVALSRMMYGLAYSSKYYTENLQKANNLVDFQFKYLIGKDSVGDYSVSFMEGMFPDFSNELDVWQQAYGLCGLTELYRTQPSYKLLVQINELHDAFIARFHDKENGGFWGAYNILTGPVNDSKSLQSLMYPLTAYMVNLWSADTANRTKYEPYIMENMDLLYQNGWDREIGWVNVKFDDEWNGCRNAVPKFPCYTVAPGHNFQLAALLLRASKFPFLEKGKQKDYRETGLEIIKTTLEKPIFDSVGIGNGFFSEMNPLTDETVDKSKTWWQHTEAIIALSLCDGKYAKEQAQLEHFFYTSFPDFENKGEFFFLYEDNQPFTDEQKGSIGKSAYHTVEMIRFSLESKNK